MADLRVTDTQGYLLYREVEPVQPYPRIDPQQPYDEKPRTQDQAREKKDTHLRRRFVAMRHLIDRLKEFGQLERINYSTLVNNLGNIGVAHADKELFELLQAHQVPDSGLNHLAAQIRPLIVAPDIGFGPPLEVEQNVLPYFSRGLSAVQLRYLHLELLPGQEGPVLVDAIARDGSFRCATRRLRVEFHPQVKTQYDCALVIDIRIIVAVGEMDEDKRRAILFERFPGVFALYTDKQISLSI
ncbi:MAG: hypothetical protein K0A94_01285 [Desulfuromonadales bacterium]|nr:hypothetical protein [Desulfuromonadales bacterium]